MKLFGKRKKENESPEREFENDMNALLSQNVTGGTEGACRMEYNKALTLLSEDGGNASRRAYSIMYGLATQYDWPPACRWMGGFCENVTGNAQDACSWYRRASQLGDAESAKRYADMLLSGNGTEKDIEGAVRWYEVAAAAGDCDALCKLGEYYLHTGKREMALDAYTRAAQRGSSSARIRINQIKNNFI